MRRVVHATCAAWATLVDVPGRRCRWLSRYWYASSAFARPQGVRAQGSLRRSSLCPMAPTPLLPEESSAPRAFTRRSSPARARLPLNAGIARKATTRRRCPHRARGRGWQAKLAPEWTRGPSGLNRPSRYRLRCTGRRRSETGCCVQNRSSAWVLPWLSGAALLSVTAGLLAHALVSSSGVPATTAWLAGVTASAAAARILLATPAAIKALMDLRA